MARLVGLIYDAKSVKKVIAHSDNFCCAVVMRKLSNRS